MCYNTLIKSTIKPVYCSFIFNIVTLFLIKFLIRERIPLIVHFYMLIRFKPDFQNQNC